MFRTECCLVTGLLLSSSCASPALRARAVPALCQMPSGTQGSFTFFLKISCAYGLRVWGCACMCNVRCPGQSCQFSGLVIVSSNPIERWIFFSASCRLGVGRTRQLLGSKAGDPMAVRWCPCLE